MFVFGATTPPPVGHDLLSHHVSRSHTMEDSSGRLISSSQRPIPDNTQHTQQTSMPPVGFEPTISSGKRPQTHALDRAATGTGGRGNMDERKQDVGPKYSLLGGKILNLIVF